MVGSLGVTNGEGLAAYDIEATVSAGEGTIETRGFAMSNYDEPVNVVPADGYYVQSLTVNGEAADALYLTCNDDGSVTYTVSNAAEDKAIEAKFAAYPTQTMSGTLTVNGAAGEVQAVTAQKNYDYAGEALGLADPFAGRSGNDGQAFRAEHHEGDHGHDQHFAKTKVKHESPAGEVKRPRSADKAAAVRNVQRPCPLRGPRSLVRLPDQAFGFSLASTSTASASAVVFS